MELLHVFPWRLQSESVLRSARRDAFLHQLLDPLDQEFLFRRLDQNPRFFTLI
jgi:hypothetical protein